MVILIAGATHTGKTLLAQRLLEKQGTPYLSIDHLKMGMIRSGYTHLTPYSPDEELTAYLWPIVREIVKTAIENHQNLVLEGCYIPYDYKKDFDETYLPHIKALWLIFSERYVQEHFEDILRHEAAIERRKEISALQKEELLQAARQDLDACIQHGLPYVLIDECYEIDLDLLA
ncbi:clathrin light chain [Ruminococcaceae bacterium OttesenSCG-928-O06]|nr:clathrin light chain [Ruminococcaceae bacterium OttesenSCG-928-O06]